MSVKAATKRVVKRRVASVCLIGIAAIGAAAWVNRPRPLLEVARTFSTVPAWGAKQLFPTFNHYYWLSADEALVVPDVSGPPNGSPYRTGADKGNVAGSHGSLPFPMPPTARDPLAISPDGRWMAYMEDTTASSNDLVARRIDGSRLVRWTCGSYADIRQAAWAPDSGSLVMLRSRPEACLTRFDLRTRRSQKTALPPELGLAYHEFATPLGFTGTRSLLIARDGAGLSAPSFWKLVNANGTSTMDMIRNYPRMDIVEISLGEEPKLIRSYSPTTPADMGYGVVVLSPRGDRLLWGCMNVTRRSPLESWLHRFIPAVPGNDTLIERGIVTRLDGSDARLIGSYDIPDPRSPSSPITSPWIIDPAWTPDGKRIGFVYKDKLMVVDAE